MKRVLLTGGTGFVGRHCLAPLLSRGYEVHGLTIDPIEGLSGRVCWHRVNMVEEAGLLRRTIEGVRPTHLLHLAWYTTPGEYWSSTENLRWARATLDLLHGFAACGGSRVVGAGSCAEYDWTTPGGVCLEGTTPERPATVYGVCKKAMHDVAMGLDAQGALQAAWGRIFFLYGPGEHPARLVPAVINALLRGEEAACTAGTQVRDFMHVAEVAEALVALLSSEVRGAVNIASGQPVALKQIMATIGQQTGGAGLLRLGARPIPQGEPPSLTASVERLHNEVGWQPTRSLEAGLQETVRWWREQPRAWDPRPW